MYFIFRLHVNKNLEGRGYPLHLIRAINNLYDGTAIVICTERGKTDPVMAVSYTHLDVYKRQVYVCVSELAE